ncbi:MAG: DNA gyrase subunit A, partial [Gammaproteobacteria bacterium]
EVIALSIPDKDFMLIATENGYGKRTRLDDFPVQSRGGQGVIAIQTSARNGRVIGALQVSREDEIILISSNGTLVRTPTAEISVMGRNTQGVRLIRLDKGDKLVGLERVEVLREPGPD